MCTKTIIKMVNLCYDVYNYAYNMIYNQTITDSVMDTKNVQILGALINNSNDITEKTLGVVQRIGKKIITVADLIDDKCHSTFDTLEVMILLHGHIRSHTYTKLDEHVHFHYGLHWPKYLDTTHTIKNLQYLDLVHY